MNNEMIFRVFECDHILSFVRETEIQQQLVDVSYTKDDTPLSSHYNTEIFPLEIQKQNMSKSQLDSVMCQETNGNMFCDSLTG